MRRWSRLKQQAREEQLPEAPPPHDLPATVAATDRPPPEAEDKAEAKPFDPATLPSVESLDKDSDYSQFMRPEVPEDLRQKALRRLWAIDAVLSAPDPLDMHNIDYNAVPTFPEGFKSLAQVAEDVAGEAAAESPTATAADSPESARDDRADAVPAAEAPPDAHPPDAAAQQGNASKVKDSGENNA